MVNHLNSFIASLLPNTKCFQYKELENPWYHIEGQCQEHPVETHGEYSLSTPVNKQCFYHNFELSKTSQLHAFTYSYILQLHTITRMRMSSEYEIWHLDLTSVLLVKSSGTDNTNMAFSHRQKRIPDVFPDEAFRPKNIPECVSKSGWSESKHRLWHGAPLFFKSHLVM